MSRTCVVAALVATATVFGLVTPGVAAADTGAGAGPRVEAGWPGSPLPAVGRIVSAAPLTGAAALPIAAQNWKILYTSSTQNRKPTVVSGTVAIPRGRPPAGGWPVVSWAHGTTGVADVCAPSNDTVTGPAHDYLVLMDETLDKWVARGFVVVQTDYQGLGTPGPHPYIIGRSEAYGVIDIVRAARQLNPHVGRKWVVIGHSQGGQAALFTDKLARARAPELDFRGAVAIAPGSFFSTFAAGILSGNPIYAAAIAFLPLVMTGAAAADPAVQPEKLLTPDALHLYQLAQTTDCIAQLRVDAAAIPVTDVFVPNADTSAMDSVLARNEPATLHLHAPVLVVQGSADVTVAKPQTDAVVAALCANGATLEYRVYPGADHRGSVAASLTDVENWVGQRLTGVRAPSTC
ncbi:MAG TPA: lipase family protein [Jatrophihabitans sp.]|nr:lipase family protein [Jatrophihabitans sp.]